MVLVDTSIWVDHLRTANATLSMILNRGLVLIHPYVLGEIACGNIRNRAVVLGYLGTLDASITATDEEALRVIENKKLWKKGIGWIDVHLLTSALLTECEFWTKDKRLAAACHDLGVLRFRP